MYKAFSSGLIGFNSTLGDSIPLAVKYGYEGIDFDVEKEAGGDAAELKALLEKNHLKGGSFNLPLEFRTTEKVFEEGMARLDDYCKFAAGLGCTRCTTWLMPCSDTLDYAANFELHKTRLSRAAEILAAHGIRLGLEFVGPPSLRKGKKYEFIHNLDQLLDLTSTIKSSNIGMLIDCYHWDLAGQVYADFRKIPGAEFIVAAHINDAPAGIPMDELLDGERELPGATGVIKIADFLRGLNSLRYDGPVYVEPFYAPFKKMTLEEAVKLSKAAMDKVWA
jgi:sugar phosphate isomerase/epimerase